MVRPECATGMLRALSSIFGSSGPEPPELVQTRIFDGSGFGVAKPERQDLHPLRREWELVCDMLLSS